MSATLPLHEMSVPEKLRVMEALWEDLSRNSDALESPRWHKAALGPVNTKRWVALPGIWPPGEATKPGYTLCGLDRIRQRSPAVKERQPEGQGSLGRGSCVAHSVK